MSRDKSEGDEQLLWWSMKVDTNVLYISVVEGDALGALDALDALDALLDALLGPLGALDGTLWFGGDGRATSSKCFPQPH
jgi:hypothetical protein